ncbi:MAG: lysylphosphatidylglycerol synthase transmembrane domain-containing protein [Bacteroidota bacterium]|nr:lysylphosphatidylglycerol synthase transmembrane domain-containing protein [Bacteroidota bacterium]
MKPSSKNGLKTTAFILLGLALLWLALRGQDTKKLWSTVTHADYKWVIIAMSIGLLSHILRALRWNQLLAATGRAPSTLNTFCAVMVGYMVNYAIPRAGEVSRCAMLKKSDDIDLEKSVGSVVAERVFDVVVMLLLLGLAFVFQYELISQLYNDLKKQTEGTNGNSLLMPILLGCMAGFAMLVFVLRKRIVQMALYHKVKNLFFGFWQGLKSILVVKNKFLFLLYTVAIWFCYLMMMYTAFKSIPATHDLTFSNAITVLVAGSLAMIVPTPGGVGAFQLISAYTLMLFSVPRADGDAWANIVFFAQLIMFVVMGSLCYFWLIFKSKNLEPKRTNIV